MEEYQRGAFPWHPDALDITDGYQVPWWLWACNLGGWTEEVIGVGVCKVELMRWDANQVAFRFTRADDTQAVVMLGEEQRQGSTRVTSWRR